MNSCHFCDLYRWRKAHEYKDIKTEYGAALIVKNGLHNETYQGHKLRFCPTCGKRLEGNKYDNRRSKSKSGKRCTD